MDALVRFASYSDDPKVLETKKRIFQTLISSQLDSGYIGTFGTGDIEIAFDLHEMVYIITALVEDFNYFGYTESLNAAVKLGNYIMEKRTAQWIFNNIQDVRKLNIERAFILLGYATGAEKYIEYGADCMKLRTWNLDPDNQHAYWYLNRCVAQLDLYRTEQDDRLLEMCDMVIDYMADNGMYITGEVGIGEVFSKQQYTDGNTGETCATAYLLRMLHNLVQLKGGSQYGNLMERVIYNALFAIPSEDGRDLRYYTTIDGIRYYMNTDTYCCPGNYRRIVSELPEMIYYKSENGIAVNLYCESEAEIDVDGTMVKLKQITEYPSNGDIKIVVNPEISLKFDLYVRIPTWCAKPEVYINGAKMNGVKSGEFYKMNRMWSKDDTVKLKYPMAITLVEGTMSKKDKVAVMYGPTVFCLAYDDIEKSNALRSEIALLDAETGAVNMTPVSLADIVGGGGGFGAGRTGNGTDIRTGNIVSGMTGQVWWHSANNFIESASPFINGVVIPNGEVQITSTGIKVNAPSTNGSTTGYIMNGQKSTKEWGRWDGIRYGASVSPMAGIAEPYYTTEIGGVEYNSEGHTIISLESNKAITFDIAAIRNATGYREMVFTAVVGYCSKINPTVDITVFIDGKTKT